MGTAPKETGWFRRLGKAWGGGVAKPASVRLEVCLAETGGRAVAGQPVRVGARKRNGEEPGGQRSGGGLS